MNEQAIDQALWWLCDLEIKTDKGTITYNKESWKYESAWKEITKEELVNWYKINEITAKVKWETWEIANWRTITVNDNAYEGRFLNNDWTWLEYRSQDLKKDPLMSMIRIADNLDMAFNRLIPSQSNAIFLTTLYNLENKWEIANWIDADCPACLYLIQYLANEQWQKPELWWRDSSSTILWEDMWEENTSRIFMWYE